MLKRFARWVIGDDELLMRAEAERVRLEAELRASQDERARLMEYIERLQDRLLAAHVPRQAASSALGADPQMPQRILVGSDIVRQHYKRFVEDLRSLSGGGDGDEAAE